MKQLCLKLFKTSYLAIFCCLFTQCAVLAAELPDLSIQLGNHNITSGLFVPSAGDGTNIPVIVKGSPARRISGEYLYVGLNLSPGNKDPLNLYVIAEIFDDTVALVPLEFDQAAKLPNIASKYTPSKQVALLSGTKKWISQTYFLPQARLGHGQNGNTDFRLCAKGIAVRRISVTSHRPPDFDPDNVSNPSSLRELKVIRPSGMAVTFGNDASQAQADRLKMLSATSVESYVDWAGVEPVKGQWDWGKWDRQVATLNSSKMKWVPFLVAGPAYATPLWFQNSPDSHNYRCLEHEKDSKVQSLFNPLWPEYVERFIKTFADRYRDQDVIESVQLGISGIFGESIYPAGPENSWTARLTGDYHYHDGWWAADADAVAAFRTAMQNKYLNIASLNKAWKTSFNKFADVSTFLPTHASSDQSRSDLEEWYQQSLTDWAIFWVKTARKYFPKTEIYLATGGNGDPMLGADFTAQVAAIAGTGVGVRITNEGSDYVKNFTLTREVASATRFYKTFSGFEPGGDVTETGIIACQSALKIDPPSASKIDPPQVVVFSC